LSKRIAAAILMCAIMVLVAAAPLAVGSTHYVLKGDQGPRTSAVTWKYVPASNGTWNGHIANDGLRSLVVDVYDITSSVPAKILHQRIRFATYDAYPSGTVYTANVTMTASHLYEITVTPNGPRGSACNVEDKFQLANPPVAVMYIAFKFLRVVVDGSLSYDIDGTIVSYDWDFGDGSSATGVDATHTYAAAGMYTVVLKVTDNSGYSGSTLQHIVAVFPLFASFMYMVDGFTVNVNASSSWSEHGVVSYAWDWGDGTTGTGVIATHTYATPTPLLESVMPDSASYVVFGYTYGPDGNPMGSCLVNITDTRTGDSIYTYSDPYELMGLYDVDISRFTHAWTFGDVLNISATKGTFIGYTEAPITDNPNGYLRIDVTLNPAANAVVKTVTLTLTDTIGLTCTTSRTVTLFP
jgi:PKD repeat protein